MEKVIEEVNKSSNDNDLERDSIRAKENHDLSSISDHNESSINDNNSTDTKSNKLRKLSIVLKPNKVGEYTALYNVFLASHYKPTSEDYKRFLVNLFYLMISNICDKLTKEMKLATKDELAILCYNNIKDIVSSFDFTYEWLNSLIPNVDINLIPPEFLEYVNYQLTSQPKKWGTLNRKFPNYEDKTFEDKLVVYNGNRFFNIWLKIKRVINNYLSVFYINEIKNGQDEVGALVDCRTQYWYVYCNNKSLHSCKQRWSANKYIPTSNEQDDEILYCYNKIINKLDDDWYPNEWFTFVYHYLPSISVDENVTSNTKENSIKISKKLKNSNRKSKIEKSISEIIEKTNNETTSLNSIIITSNNEEVANENDNNSVTNNVLTNQELHSLTSDQQNNLSNDHNLNDLIDNNNNNSSSSKSPNKKRKISLSKKTSDENLVNKSLQVQLLEKGIELMKKNNYPPHLIAQQEKKIIHLIIPDLDEDISDSDN